MAEELATLPKPEIPAAGRIGFKEALGVSEPFLQRKAEMQPQIAAAEGDIAKAKQAQSEVLAGGKMAAQEKFGKEEAAARGAYEGKLEAEPLPAFIPTKDTVQDIAGLFSVIGVIGMLVGGGGKMAGQRAMGAMNGMMEGYRKGRSDLYKQQRNEFDANFKTMLQKHQEFRKEMDDAVKLASTNKEAGMAAAELAATKAGSDIVKAQLRRGDLMGAYKLVDESEKGAVHAFDTVAKQRENEAKEIAAAQRHKEDMAQRERSHRETIAAANERARLSREKPEKPATRKETLPLIQGIRSVEKLQEDLRDPEIRTGLIAKAAPLLEKIASLRPDKNFEEGVNQTLTGTDKTTVFLKNALLNSYAIERAASGGGRLTVAMMRQAGPVLDPTNYTPQAYSQILEDRRKEFYENLQDYGFTPEQISETTSPRPYQPFGGGAPAPASSNIDTERSSAKAAIAAGAPEAKVKERFKQKTGQEL